MLTLYDCRAPHIGSYAKENHDSGVSSVNFNGSRLDVQFCKVIPVKAQ